MRTMKDVFHLAIPSANLDESFDFYITRLGCKLARRYEDRITIDFFGDQLVCHLCPEKVDTVVEIYPRHFGVTFREKDDFDRLYLLASQREIKIYKEKFIRFKGKAEEHETFFLLDPSNNLLEFKYYFDHRMMY